MEITGTHKKKTSIWQCFCAIAGLTDACACMYKCFGLLSLDFHSLHKSYISLWSFCFTHILLPFADWFPYEISLTRIWMSLSSYQQQKQQEQQRYKEKNFSILHFAHIRRVNFKKLFKNEIAFCVCGITQSRKKGIWIGDICSKT